VKRAASRGGAGAEPGDRFTRILQSPALYPGVAEALGPGFPWHTHAGSARSSQALCLSVWVPLAELRERHVVIEAFLHEVLPEPPRSPGARRWTVSVEVSRPELLGEVGGPPSRIDVLLEADDAVIGLESKYLGDAAGGAGRCSQYPRACRGFYGPGSDLTTRTGAPCRLAVADGRRQARRYWSVAERLLQPAALAYGREPGSCPLQRSFQLARTLFFAAEAARQRETAAGRPPGTVFFAAVAAVPEATAAPIERQVAELRDELLPAFTGRLAAVHYERLAQILCAGGPRTASVGRFLDAKLAALSSSTAG